MLNKPAPRHQSLRAPYVILSDAKDPDQKTARLRSGFLAALGMTKWPLGVACLILLFSAGTRQVNAADPPQPLYISVPYDYADPVHVCRTARSVQELAALWRSPLPCAGVTVPPGGIPNPVLAAFNEKGLVLDFGCGGSPFAKSLPNGVGLDLYPFGVNRPPAGIALDLTRPLPGPWLEQFGGKASQVFMTYTVPSYPFPYLAKMQFMLNGYDTLAPGGLLHVTPIDFYSESGAAECMLRQLGFTPLYRFRTEGMMCGVTAIKRSAPQLINTGSVRLSAPIRPINGGLVTAGTSSFEGGTSEACARAASVSMREVAGASLGQMGLSLNFGAIPLATFGTALLFNYREAKLDAERRQILDEAWMVTHQRNAAALLQFTTEFNARQQEREEPRTHCGPPRPEFPWRLSATEQGQWAFDNPGRGWEPIYDGPPRLRGNRAYICGVRACP